MAAERLPMRKIREILRLRWVLEYGVRQTASSAGVSTGVVSRTTQRAQAVGLTWDLAEAMTETALEERLYGRSLPPGAARAEPGLAWMHTELKRPGMTLELLHLEYLAQHPDGLRYTAFCDRYRRWKRRRKVTLRQPHKAGERLQVDFSGKRPWLTDRETGERTQVELFVGVLPASGMIFAKATRTQQLADWVNDTNHRGANTFNTPASSPASTLPRAPYRRVEPEGTRVAIPDVTRTMPAGRNIYLRSTNREPLVGRLPRCRRLGCLTYSPLRS